MNHSIANHKASAQADEQGAKLGAAVVVHRLSPPDEFEAGFTVTLNLFRGPVLHAPRGSTLDAETSSA